MLAEQHFAQPADSRGFMVAPYHGVGIAQGECFEDDGESEAWRSGEYDCWKVNVESDAATLTITVNWTGHYRRPFDTVEMFIPAADARRIAAIGATIGSETPATGWTRLVLALPPEPTALLDG
jgi:alpha-glucosidase